MKDILRYYCKDGTLKIFDKYMLYHFGFIRNRKTGKVLQNSKIGEYNITSVVDEEDDYIIRIARAIASTFIGPPPTLKHTADHIDRNPDDDNIYNIRWATESEQNTNQESPENHKDSFIIIKDGVEKTSKEWVEHLREETNPFDRKYTEVIVSKYARQKYYGFAYKEYPDLPNETWKMIPKSKTSRGCWMISDMNRVKYITRYAENLLSGKSLGLVHGYPVIGFNGKKWRCHILAFMTFFPDEYAAKKPEEIILHKHDDKLDFRPHMLRIGTHSENSFDSYDNGCRDGTQTERQKCISYINGIYEIQHDSQCSAAIYLNYIGYKKASQSAIGRVLSGGRKTAYDRTWKLA
jgi:hypothetical protein